MDIELLTIEQAAERTWLSAHTLRYQATGNVSFAKGWVLLSGVLNSILYHKKLYP